MMKTLYEIAAIVFACGLFGICLYIMARNLFNFKYWQQIIPMTAIVASLVYVASLVLTPVAIWHHIQLFEMCFKSSALFVVNFTFVYLLGIIIALCVECYKDKKELKKEEEARANFERLVRYCEDNNVDLYL